MSSLAERVAKGAAYLDEHHPGWSDRIDRIDRTCLDMGHCAKCVLGQLFDGWVGAVKDRWPDVWLDPEYGFDRFLDEPSFEPLTAEWLALLETR